MIAMKTAWSDFDDVDFNRFFLGIFAMTRRISISFQGVDTTNIQWNIRLEHPPTVDDTGGESCWFHIVLWDMIINCHIGLSWVISVAIYILYIWLVVTGTMEFHDFPIILGMECHHPN